MDIWELATFRLARDGYASVPEIENMPTDKVIRMLHHSSFTGEYESAFADLNRKDAP